MALTKVTKSGLADNSVDAAKLVDGTVVAADINDGTITNAKLAGSIANNKLANSSITVNGSALSLGGSITSQHIDWQSVVTSNTTMVSGKGYFVNTTSGAITMTLPASPSAGDYVAIKDYAATFQTNSCTIGRNSSNIQGNANDSLLDTTRASVVLVYADSTKGWLYTNESNVADLEFNLEYIGATGGTVATSGNYKIHTFTSSSNFVVSQASNQSHTVDYLVIAGGGGGGSGISGGGGAGGFRTNYPSPDTGGLAITAQTYPITVGAGSSSQTSGVTPGSLNRGSNSVFSTITSTGGGAGGNGQTGGGGGSAGQPGGSGGGGGYNTSTPHRGAGNTPPVSPPQGNPGGSVDSGPGVSTGGGGGAGAVGASGTSGNPGGNGGVGTANSITGSSVTRAGGGGAGGYGDGGIPGGSAGSGGGGTGGTYYQGSPSGGQATAGTANTGGGGGGGGESTNPGGDNSGLGGNGGSGVVILRYKYQN